MSTGVLLSYSGIGSNLLHLPYIHEVARKDGPIELITFSEKIPFILKSDPSLKNISYINKYNKKSTDGGGRTILEFSGGALRGGGSPTPGSVNRRKPLASRAGSPGGAAAALPPPTLPPPAAAAAPITNTAGHHYHGVAL